MESNGFGSYIQKIVIRVERHYAQQAQEALSAVVENETDTHIELLWTPRSTKRGDDEGIVFELDMLLKKIPWEARSIIWDRCIY